MTIAEVEWVRDRRGRAVLQPRFSDPGSYQTVIALSSLGQQGLSARDFTRVLSLLGLQGQGALVASTAAAFVGAVLLTRLARRVQGRAATAGSQPGRP